MTSAALLPGDPATGQPPLPAGRALDLAGRGTTFVRELPGSDGPPIVLLHGWTVTAALNWFPHFEALTTVGPVVALDHRGHGQGIRPDGPFLLADATDDVAALIEQLDLGPSIVVGYSMGGAIAQMLAHQRPDLVAGLVLSGTWTSGPSTPRFNRLLRLAGVGGKAMRKLSDERQERLVERAFRMVQGRDPLERPQWFVDEVRSASMPHIVDAGRELARFDSRPWLAELRMPAGVLVTARDALVSPGHQHELASRIGHAEIESVPLDHADVVIRADAYRGPFVDLVARIADHAR